MGARCILTSGGLLGKTVWFTVFLKVLRENFLKIYRNQMDVLQ